MWKQTKKKRKQKFLDVILHFIVHFPWSICVKRRGSEIHCYLELRTAVSVQEMGGQQTWLTPGRRDPLAQGTNQLGRWLPNICPRRGIFRLLSKALLGLFFIPLHSQSKQGTAPKPGAHRGKRHYTSHLFCSISRTKSPGHIYYWQCAQIKGCISPYVTVVSRIHC